MKRIKTDYPGVFYREADRIGGKGTERVFYIVFKKAGKVYEEKAGRQYADDMTPAKANNIRADRIEGRRESRKEIRERGKAAKLAEAGKWTLKKLFDEYQKSHKAAPSDKSRFALYLNPNHGEKEPSELHQLDMDRLRINLLKSKSPQTVKHVLGLLKRLCNFGINKQLCQGINFKIEMPQVDNTTTEDLTPDQLKSLLKAINESTDIEAANIMRMALFTGMRRGELFKLKWTDIDYDRGFINIRHDPKGGKSQMIPLNEQARAILESHPKTKANVFVRGDGKPFTDIRRRINPIKKAAGLPADFRPLHGLRHAYASMLASSGQVDLYTLQKLLTHKSPQMTQRYAHLRDETMKKAATLAGNIIEQAAKAEDQDGKEAIGA